jgi:sugar lactone lactonase YvrE
MSQCRAAAILLCASIAAGCKSDSSGPGAGTTGTLAVTITAPIGVTPKVLIIAPNGTITTISSSQNITLAAGVYDVVAQPGVTTDAIVSVGYAGTVVGSPAGIPAGGGASASVTYSAPWSATGKLWTSNGNGATIAGFTSAQLSASGSPAPAVVLGNGGGTSSVKGPASVAVDNSGGLWFTNITDTLYYFTAAQITSSTNSAPAVKLVAPSLTSATFATLDAQGNLWVCDQFLNTVSEFTKAQLAASGTVTPAVVITSALGSIARPWSMAFDSRGNLWVSNLNGNSVVGYTPAQLAASGNPVPFAAVSATKGVKGALGIAFDAGGNLWVVTILDSLSKFNASDLTTIGSPAPAVIITGLALNSPLGLAFDNSGALWVANYQSSNLLRYDASQLNATGSPTPAVTISKTGTSIALPAGIAFSPPAGNLPIH